MASTSGKTKVFFSLIASSLRVWQICLLQRRCDGSGPNLEWTLTFSFFVPDTSLAFPSQITHLCTLPHHALFYCFHSPDNPLLHAEAESGLCFGIQICILWISRFLSVVHLLPYSCVAWKKRQSHFLIKAANHLEGRFGCVDRSTWRPNHTRQISIVSTGSRDNGSRGLSLINWGHRLGLA